MNARDWQPIETYSAREAFEEVLVTDGADVGTAQLSSGGRWVMSACGESVWEGDGEYGGLKDVWFTPTHWMPLPEPPSKVRVEDGVGSATTAL